MDTDVMKTFCDLVETGSFSRAAEANFVSQSAVSQQLAKLERQFSTQLMDRGGGMVSPTSAGQALYKGAKDIVRRHEQLIGEIRSVADSVRGILRVGTIYSVGFYLLDPYVRTFLKRHPEVNLHVSYTNWHQIYASIISGDMDLGVVACGEKRRSVEIIPLASEELVAVFSPDHELAEREVIDPASLSGENFVAFEANIPTRRHIDRMLKRAKIEVNIVMEFDNNELLKRAIMVGSGVGILPRDNVEREVAYGDLACARLAGRGNEWTRPVGIVRRRGESLTPAGSMFLGLLRSQGSVEGLQSR